MNEAQAMVAAQKTAMVGVVAAALIGPVAGGLVSFLVARLTIQAESTRLVESRKAEDDREAARQALDLGLKAYQSDFETKPHDQVHPPFVYVYEQRLPLREAAAGTLTRERYQLIHHEVVKPQQAVTLASTWEPKDVVIVDEPTTAPGSPPAATTAPTPQGARK